jgi:hypothetical protein
MSPSLTHTSPSHEQHFPNDRRILTLLNGKFRPHKYWIIRNEVSFGAVLTNIRVNNN